MTANPFNAVLSRFGSRFDPEVLESTIAHWQPRVRLRQGLRAPMIEDIEYGDHSRHRMDVFPVKAINAPMVLFVHGGGFIGGDKRIEDPFYANVGRYFASHGIVCACMNYRLAPAGGWPAAAQDIELAARWLLDRGDLYGGDAHSLTVVGQSAGACHVATWLLAPQFASATRDAIPSAVLMSGLYAARAPLTTGQRAYFGDDESLYRERSPQSMARPITQRLLVTRAEADPPSLRVQSQDLVNAMGSYGVDITLLDLPHHNHISPLLSLGSDCDAVGAQLRDFIVRANRTTSKNP